MTQNFTAGIIATGSYLPSKILTNSELETMIETTDEWIITRTGIKERRIAAKDEATSDLATKAALKAMEAGNVKPEEIDLIIVATVTPDMVFPSTACLVQKNIGATKAAAFDLEAACTGFIYGTAMADQMVKTGFYKKVLVIGAETLSRIVDWSDRNTCVLFGDGAGAAIIGQVPEGSGILANYLGADGNGGEFLKLPAGGSRLSTTEDTLKSRLHYINMKGNDVYKFAVKIMGNAAEEVLKRADIDPGEIDLLIPHQANNRIVECAVKRLNLSMDKVIVNLQYYGNTSAASIPVALDEAVRTGRIKKDDIVLMVGFGGGLTWGSTVVKWV